MRHLLLFTVLLAAPIAAQAPDRALRDSAVTLERVGKQREAFALFERVASAGSADPVVHERLGFLILKFSGVSDDPAVRRAERVRARAALRKAIALGSKDAQAIAYAEAIPEDGGDDPSFSDDPKVQEAMRRAESAYSRTEYRAALGHYQDALRLDPKMYSAALFSGDAHLHLGPVDSAYLWYGRATVIDPDQVTAWRYWSDVLLKNGRLDDARDKAIEAVIAGPGDRLALTTLITWAQRAGVSPAFPRLAFLGPDSTMRRHPARLAYDSVRTAWRGPAGKGSPFFALAYPADTAYRHSLREERTAVQAAIKAGGDDPAVAVAGALERAGHLEAYLLVATPTAGMYPDYLTVRAANRDVLRRFWREVVIGGKVQ